MNLSASMHARAWLPELPIQDKALGIRTDSGALPEARGCSERAFGTIQGRLLHDLRASGITTDEQAKRYFEEVFVPDFTRRFTVTPLEKATPSL